MFEIHPITKGEVPGASPKDCGNYLDMDLGMANYLAKRYLDNHAFNTALTTAVWYIRSDYNYLERTGNTHEKKSESSVPWSWKWKLSRLT